MRNFVRFLVAAMALWCAGQAAAATNYYWQVDGGVWGGSTQYDSALAACSAIPAGNSYTFDQMGTSYGGPITATHAQYWCMGHLKSKTGASPENTYIVDRVGDTCPSPKVYDAATGFCAGAPVEDCTAGKPFTVVARVPAIANQLPDRNGTCELVIDTVVTCYQKLTGIYAGVDFCEFTAHKDGQKAAGTGLDASPPSNDNAPSVANGDTPKNIPPTSASPLTNSCPVGTVNGGTDSYGTPICMGSGTSTDKNTPPVTVQPQIKITDSAGNVTTYDTTITGNADGSKTTTTVTTKTGTDGTKTTGATTTTGTNSAGTPGVASSRGVGAAGKDAQDMCSSHPELNVCKNSTVSGSCAAVTCTGDAIQCSIYRSVAKNNCDVAKDNADMAAMASKTLGDQIIAGNDPMKATIATTMAGDEADMSSKVLDQSGFLGGGSCFGAKNFTFGGKSVAVDFGYLCDHIQPLRYVILAASLIVAYMLVSKSVLQG